MTDEEVLLRLRRLRSGYEYNLQIGLTYTFGSIFNTIVNPRFGNSGPMVSGQSVVWLSDTARPPDDRSPRPNRPRHRMERLVHCDAAEVLACLAFSGGLFLDLSSA